MNTAQDHELFMRLAITSAMIGVEDGQTPFGACIVRNKKVIAVEHNIVWESRDITAYAEVTAIRAACLELNTVDLSGCRIYSTCEPCPMCFAACHWAKISEIFFGTSIADAAKCGFNELKISNKHLKMIGDTSVVLTGDFLREENLQLFRMWQKRQDKKVY